MQSISSFAANEFESHFKAALMDYIASSVAATGIATVHAQSVQTALRLMLLHKYFASVRKYMADGVVPRDITSHDVLRLAHAVLVGSASERISRKTHLHALALIDDLIERLTFFLCHQSTCGYSAVVSMMAIILLSCSSASTPSWNRRWRCAWMLSLWAKA